MLKIFRSKYLNPWEDYRSMEPTTETEPAISELENLSRTRLAECYQCGKCTAGCPTAGQMDIPPTHLIRLLQLGDSQSALRAGSIWQCVSCQTRTTRCPKRVDCAASDSDQSQSRGLKNVKECEQCLAETQPPPPACGRLRP